APGGGSAAALSGTIACCLGIMVCNLTLGKEKYKDVSEEVLKAKNILTHIKVELLSAVDRDTEAFNNLMRALKLPKNTDAEKELRNKEIQKAVCNATQVPLQVMELSSSILPQLTYLAEKGNQNALSDIGVACLQAISAIKGAEFNVLINTPMIKDNEIKMKFLEKARTYSNIVEEYGRLVDTIRKKLEN
ncbi:MAG: cyclodeaminase/cyclohydrolase family protein, partial [Thermoplasmata archaeon]